VNPAQLWPSRRGNLVQLLFFLAMGAALLWVMIDFWAQVEAARQLAAMPAAIPDPTPGILFDEQLAQRGRDPSASPRELWSYLILPGVLLPVCLGLAGVRLWRLISGKPLCELANGRLILRDPLGWGSRDIPLGAISAISFGRSDRQMAARQDGPWWLRVGFAGRGARLGGRLRHTLRIDHREDRAEARTIEISDLDVAGGAAQLRSFADYLGALAARPVDTAT
jgi:hypothetical protein